MRIIFKYILALAAVSMAFTITASPVGKINARGAKIAWGKEMPLFNPTKPIPDSLAKSSSAVVIARYWKLDADYENTPSAGKIKATRLNQPFGVRTETTNITNAREIDRRMVKLLDKDAVEHFSNFEFGEKTDEWVENTHLTDIEEGFGVRIYKPDGTIREIDLSAATPISDSKKGNNKNYRIAIPGLEIGDVVDYFYYTEETREGLDISPRRISYVDRYPVLDFVAECSIDPILTLEMRAYNDAPQPEPHIVNNKNTFSIHTTDLAAMPQTKYINKSRQVPFLEMRVLNNNSKFNFRPKSARRGGVYFLEPQAYCEDIAHFIRLNKYDSGIPSQVASMVKSQIKANPDWNEKKIADYTYVALIYKALTNKDTFSPTTMAFMLRDAANKINFTAVSGIGFINSHDNVPAMLVTSWQEPEYIAMIGARPYNPAVATYCAPGEWPVAFQTEEGGCFRKLTEERTPYPEIFSIPSTTPNNNTRVDEMTLYVDPLSKATTLNTKISAIGAHKQHLAKLFNNNNIWISQAEDFLNIAPESRYIDTEFEPMSYKKRIYDTMKDEIENSTGLKPVSVDSVSITSYGIMPDAKSFECCYSATFDNIIENATNNLVVNIGRLFSDTEKLTGADRNRDFDAQVSCPNNHIRKLIIPVPDGYTVNPETLTALNKSIANRVGSFSSNATIDDDNIIINVTSQMRNYTVPAGQWQEFLDMTDAAADFADSNITLNKK